MSIYSALNTENPVICYSILHQVRPEVSLKDYTKTMEDLHRLILEESEKVDSTWREYVADIRAKAVQASRGNLSQFLTTPLQSDVNEIQRILSEQTLRIIDQVSSNTRHGVIATSEGRVAWIAPGSPAEKKLTASGRKYLQELAFALGKGKPEVFESNFFVEGGLNLDIIEHIVRDRVGIYTPVHGKHIKEFDAYAYAVHNLVIQKGDLGPTSGQFEAAFFFSKGEPKYAPFRNGLVELVEHFTAALAIEHCSVWQRKLGLGPGREFVLRTRYRNPDVLGQFIKSVHEFKTKDFVPKALLNGHLVVKELIPLSNPSIPA
ncbi:MAG: hypothetical protein WBD36_12520 [Bacteroidota bacterium]